jgi:predicted MFS family arabinose efflux permease
MTADMWEAENQGFAVVFVVLSSAGSSPIGRFFGGIIGEYLSWHWIFWVQL